jgi:TolB protein
MNSDGQAQRWLTRGSSASWSPDGTRIAFHASASGTGRPVNGSPGAATSDSDIFVATVADLLDGGTGRTNLTHSPLAVDADADWSPDGTRIAFTSHPKHADPTLDPPNPPDNEIYVVNADGTGLQRLTANDIAEAAPDWSPDGTQLAFMCRPDPAKPMQICVMNADGTGRRQLTTNAAFHGTPVWSPDGKQILFSSQPGGPGTHQQLYVMNADGTGQTQLTNTNPAVNEGLNLAGSWGLLRLTG